MLILILGSAGSAFESFNSSLVDAQQQQRQTEQQRLQNAGLELPALFHEGRRASDGLMCHNHQSGTGAGQQSPGGSTWARGAVVEGVVGNGGHQLPSMSETHREHQALCQQYGQSGLQQKQPQHQGMPQRVRPVLRQVSYKLAQQQPILLGTPVSTISETDGSSEVSPDHDPDDPRDPAMTAMMMRTTSELDEWCRESLPSSLAACDLDELQSP